PEVNTDRSCHRPQIGKKLSNPGHKVHGVLERPHRVSPNGLRLSGARRAPRSNDNSLLTACSGTAARVRCSRVLGGPLVGIDKHSVLKCEASCRDGCASVAEKLLPEE